MCSHRSINHYRRSTFNGDARTNHDTATFEYYAGEMFEGRVTSPGFGQTDLQRLYIIKTTWPISFIKHPARQAAICPLAKAWSKSHIYY